MYYARKKSRFKLDWIIEERKSSMYYAVKYGDFKGKHLKKQKTQIEATGNLLNVNL